MSDPIWKLSVDGTSVSRVWPDGHSESMLVTTPEYEAWLAAGNTPQPAQSAADIAAAQQAQLQAQAQAALVKSDVTLLRCSEHGIAIPPEWATYRAQLRQVMQGTLSVLPAQPGYPAGT
jgi:hypothetical protein